jgi:hypothetical protein
LILLSKGKEPGQLNDIAMSYGLEGLSSIPDRYKSVLCTPQLPDQLWDLLKLFYPMGTRGSFAGGKVAGS